ncbi:hypothetical protein [Bosea vaviloviae]|uniref:Uncharacterized protein n=1 Tax=Bosea vaviloviae TaxID=1526658 RepID=A0A0N0MAG4_9HYPH|nr:hypothetical protein [Bosea vaviloviae]KPH79604.1 hypothetical protein AE618_17160 [Bosea vaviloviae]
MNSSISHFSWVGLAVAGFVAIEAAIGFFAPRPDALRTNLLELSFAKPEMLQRAFVHEKLLAFDDAHPDIIQVGDSSGMHGVQSPIVESYLGGRSYLNLSVASNLGYSGFYAMARRAMERSGTVKVLVLYFTPGGGAFPKTLINGRDLMGPDLQRELVSPFHQLFHTPSLGLRRDVTDRLYYINGKLNQVGRPLIANSGYFMLRDIIAPSGGWARETDTADDTVARLFQAASPGLSGYTDEEIVRIQRANGTFANVPRAFDWSKLSYRTTLEMVLDDYLALARKHGARLVVATNPVPESFRSDAFKVGFDMDGISRALKDYGAQHQDVSILDISYWPDSKFSVFSHIATPYSAESSHRVGRFLAGLDKDLPPPNARQTPYRSPDRVVLDMGASPTLYGFDAAEKAAGTTFRRLRAGRYEALAYARVNPQAQQELRISVLNAPDDAVLRDIAIGIYGSAATRLPDIQDDGKLILRFSLPSEATQRFGGWLELTLSTRGATTWQTNALDPAATGPQLQIDRMELVSP